MQYKVTTRIMQCGVAVPGGDTVRMYGSEADGHRGFLDAKDDLRATFSGNSTSATVVFERAASQDWHDVERLATYTIQRGTTRNAVPVESMTYHAQIAAPSAPKPKPVQRCEPAKPKLYSIKTKAYYCNGEWDQYFETEEQARAALSRLMETERQAIERESGDPRREYELLYNRTDCIANMEIYKNHDKVATVRK